MAETLGSLIDKLSIKAIREFHIRKMLAAQTGKRSGAALRGKLDIVGKQKRLILAEVEEFILSAIRQGTVPRDEKLKLYNKPEAMNKIGRISSLAKGIDALMKKNLELWHLEDEARREDAPLAYIGRIKRKIDAANQQRNDLMDRIDELLEQRLLQNRTNECG
ncbi:MAG: DUF4254 domain-containing protein [Candidatus Omnitrophica bacterium]|nr:DUF4254 domain-containing protein [Candidatus Omnitrophota bacterium]